MPDSKRSKTTQSPSNKLPARRIETQIHRRKKARALSPLQAEWDESSPHPPENLRTPSDKMKRTREL